MMTAQTTDNKMLYATSEIKKKELKNGQNKFTTKYESGRQKYELQEKCGE
jgi:hypothetical protein